MSPFKVWYPEHGDEDDAQTFSAHHADDAARDWAQRADYESNDYWIVGGQTPIVHVRCVTSQVLSKFRVRGEPSIDYYVTEV